MLVHISAPDGRLWKSHVLPQDKVLNLLKSFCETNDFNLKLMHFRYDCKKIELINSGGRLTTYQDISFRDNATIDAFNCPNPWSITKSKKMLSLASSIQLAFVFQRRQQTSYMLLVN